MTDDALIAIEKRYAQWMSPEEGDIDDAVFIAEQAPQLLQALREARNEIALLRQLLTSWSTMKIGECTLERISSNE